MRSLVEMLVALNMRPSKLVGDFVRLESAGVSIVSKSFSSSPSWREPSHSVVIPLGLVKLVGVVDVVGLFLVVELVGFDGVVALFSVVGLSDEVGVVDVVVLFGVVELVGVVGSSFLDSGMVTSVFLQLPHASNQWANVP